ncbi:MAG: U32 family peptidase [Clostridia bacterium]|nr:U32 family peptidase [Clostridia bacterium]
MSFSSPESRNKIEILAPAGSREQLVAAVRSGADAVYLGAGGLNARRNAENFSTFPQLREAVEYCHASGVQVHLTSNILVRDDEWDQAEQLIGQACALGADAVIVQDAGLARTIRTAAPELVMHASTQMSLHTPGGAMAAAGMGFKRAVLSRELSGKEIADIVAVSPIETEVFIHGALCMCLSGQCLFSAVLGGRSGNRGLCAQPCRLPFRVTGDRSGFDGCMSLKDMSHIEYIPALEEMGVASVKIEGRMKRPEYVAAAVTACRLMRDEGEVPADLSEKLMAVFSRSGFTDGYFTGKRGRGMFGTRTKEDVVSASSALLGSLHPLYKNEFQRVPLQMKLTAADEALPASLEVCDRDGHSVAVTGEKPQPARNATFSEEYAGRILGKTGGTPFYLDSVQAEVGEGLTLPSSALSSMKREALERLDSLRRAAKPIAFDPDAANGKPSKRRCFGNEKPALRVIFRRAEQVPEELRGVSMVYLPLETEGETLARIAQKLRAQKIIPAVEAPRGLFGAEKQIEACAMQAGLHGMEDIMIHNAGLIPVMKKIGMTIHGGFGLNVFNSRSLDEYAELGISDSELSLELTLAQIAVLTSRQPRGMIIRGRIPMMITRNCPAALSPKGCAGLSKQTENEKYCSLTDRTGRELPVLCRTGCSEIFNPVMMSVVGNVAGKTRDELSLDWVTLSFTTESREECAAIISAYTQGTPLKESGITSGLYLKGVQ